MASFFNGVEEKYIQKLVESSQNLSLGAHRRALEDGEIDIFKADKYFSGRMDEDSTKKANSIARRRHQDKKEEPEVEPKLQPQTPSVYSESSWNSQNAFLKRPRTKPKAPKKKLFANLGCNCACSDESSVDVEDYSDDHNQGQSGVTLEKNVGAENECSQFISQDSLIFPTKSDSFPHNVEDYSDDHNQGKFGITLEKSVGAIKTSLDLEAERKSLEVFGSSKARDKGSKSFSLERRLNMLAWDATPKVEEIEIQGPIESIKDTESEASSDLFEIDCCVSPRTCYAPSEASVEWSVVTASAADFSVVSDSEEQASAMATATFRRKMLPPRPKKPTATRYGGILSGCKSQKAVRVAEDVYTVAHPRTTTTTRSDSFPKMIKFQMDTTQNVGFGSKYRKDLLYIQ